MGKLLSNMLNAANGALKPAGLTLKRIQNDKAEGPGFVLHRYLRPDGTFDYEKYRAIQTEGNVSKLDWCFVKQENLKLLAKELKQRISSIKFGICHGTRRGLEQKWLSEFLRCKVIGTEISHTADQFENTIQWDFHEVKPEWIGAVDFIYSNSFDHSYDPENCLRAWMRCLAPGGICILEHTDFHVPKSADMLDPFGAELSLMPYLVLTWGRGRFYVADIIRCPASDINSHFLLIKNC